MPRGQQSTIGYGHGPDASAHPFFAFKDPSQPLGDPSIGETMSSFATAPGRNFSPFENHTQAPPTEDYSYSQGRPRENYPQGQHAAVLRPARTWTQGSHDAATAGFGMLSQYQPSFSQNYGGSNVYQPNEHVYPAVTHAAQGRHYAGTGTLQAGPSDGTGPRESLDDNDNSLLKVDQTTKGFLAINYPGCSRQILRQAKQAFDADQWWVYFDAGTGLGRERLEISQCKKPDCPNFMLKVNRNNNTNKHEGRTTLGTTCSNLH